MRASDERLIQRLQERNAIESVQPMAASIPGRPSRRLPAKALQVAERAIGFKLPELLRAIYLKVGEWWLWSRIRHRWNQRGSEAGRCTLETCYQNMLKLENENSVWRWPTVSASGGQLRMRHVVVCGLRVSETPNDALGPEQS